MIPTTHSRAVLLSSSLVVALGLRFVKDEVKKAWMVAFLQQAVFWGAAAGATTPWLMAYHGMNSFRKGRPVTGVIAIMVMVGYVQWLEIKPWWDAVNEKLALVTSAMTAATAVIRFFVRFFM